MPNMRVEDFVSPENKRQYVTVPGRNDVGEVMHPGTNFGSLTTVMAVGIHFPLDGACAYYESSRVTYVDGPDKR